MTSTQLAFHDAMCALAADRRTYGKHAWATQPALWAIATYRLGSAIDRSTPTVRRGLWPVYRGLALVMSA